MQNLEYRKNNLFKVIESIQKEELIFSLELFVYQLIDFNPALKYVKSIKDTFDIKNFMENKSFSMQKIRAFEGQFADDEPFEELLNDLK